MSRLAHSRIRSVGFTLPEMKVSSAQLEAAFELHEKHGVTVGSIERLTGVRTRHLSEADMLPSELAYEAALDAMLRGVVKAEELDVVVYAAISRDWLEPATAHRIQAWLGAQRAFCFDISNACLSIMDGILVVDSLIGAGQARRGIVCGAELPSVGLRAAYDRLRDLRGPDEFFALFPIMTCGDAGAALVIEAKTDDEPGRGFVAFDFVSRGEHHDLCILPAVGEPMVTDSRRLIDEGTRLAVECFERVLRKSGWTRDDVDLMIPHQIALRANLQVFRAMGLPPEKGYLVVDQFGNTASTTIPLALAHAAQEGRLRPGMKVVLAGMGSGISSGFATLVW